MQRVLIVDYGELQAVSIPFDTPFTVAFHRSPSDTAPPLSLIEQAEGGEFVLRLEHFDRDCDGVAIVKTKDCENVLSEPGCAWGSVVNVSDIVHAVLCRGKMKVIITWWQSTEGSAPQVVIFQRQE